MELILLLMLLSLEVTGVVMACLLQDKTFSLCLPAAAGTANWLCKSVVKEELFGRGEKGTGKGCHR